MSDLIERIPDAIKKTEYKYFGDYKFSDDQWDAVFTLVEAARGYISQQSEIALLREALTAIVIDSVSLEEAMKLSRAALEKNND